MSQAFCLVCQAARGSFSTASIHAKYILFSCIELNLGGNTNNGKVCPCKKTSIILYHKSTNLSIGFVEFLENIFQNRLTIDKKRKVKPLSQRGNHALIAA